MKYLHTCKYLSRKILLIGLVGVLVMGLFPDLVLADPASFFDTDLAQGKSRFIEVVNTSTDDNAIFFEKTFDTSTGSEFSVQGDDGSTVYVTATKAGSAISFNSTEGATGTYFHTWGVSVSSWSDVIDQGVKFEFFEDAARTTPLEVNAVGVYTYDWGTCCEVDNYTPDGIADGTAIYSIFDGGSIGQSVELLGNILETISSTTHFVAEIDDRDGTFTEVTFAPNGDGEYFGMGGYLIFSLVPEDSVEPGSGSTPSIPPDRPDLTAATDLGDSSTDDLTSDSTPDFEVTYSPQNDFDFVNLYADGVLIATSPQAGTTEEITVSLTASTLSEGFHDITARVENGYWNDESDPSPALQIEVDGTPPTMSISAAEVSDGETSNDPSLSLTFSTTEATTDFDTGDVVVTNGSLSGFGGSGTSYSATLTPDADGEVTVNVPAGSFSDEAGNDNTAADEFNWISDQTLPTVEFNPQDGETIVANAADIILTFSEAMRRASDDGELTDANVDNHLVLKYDNSSGTNIAFDAVIDADKEVITISPGSVLDSNRQVYVAVEAELEDQADNALGEQSVTFTSADQDDPTLSDSYPTDGLDDVDVNTDLTLIFSEAVYAQTGNIEVRRSSDTGLFEAVEVNSGQVSGGGTDTITVDLSGPLASLTDYYVLIESTAFDDEDGNSYQGISDPAKLNFVTEYLDTVPPTVSFDPAEGAVNVPTNADITLTFSEPVRNLDDSPLTDSNVDGLITLKDTDGGGSDIPFDAVIDGAKEVVTITPSSNFSSEQVVYAAIGATVEDGSDNALSPASASFTVEDVDPPTLLDTTPSDDAANVGISDNLILTFNEPVDTEFGTVTIYQSSDDSVFESMSVTSATQVSGSGTDTITLNPGGTFNYVTDYYVQVDATAFDDPAGNSYPGFADSTTWNFTTAAENQPPTANDDAASTDEDSGVTIDALANDTDPNTGDVLIAAGLDTSGTMGQVVDNGDGTFDYDPDGQFEGLGAGESATDSFTYTISDGNGGSDTATVTVTVNGINDPPNAVDDAAGTDEDSPVTTIDLVDDNDSDPEGDDLTVSGINISGTAGDVTDHGDGTFTYDPDGQFEYLAVGENTTDSFTYTINDGNGNNDTATVTVTVNGANDGPDAVDDAVSTDEDTAFTTADLVAANDTDPDTSDTLSVSGLNTSGTTGLVSDNGDGTFDYDPNGQFESLAVGDSATDTFGYTVVDGNGGSDSAVVTVAISGVNDPPDVTDDSGSTQEDTPVTVAVLTNDSDVDAGDSFEVISVTQGTHGSVSFTAADVTYTPDPNYVGSDSFTYTVEDTQGGRSTATVNINSTATTDMVVNGNGISIANGDSTPSGTDGTDFGSTSLFLGTVDGTFQVENLGSVDLNLTGSPRVSIGGAHSGDFTVITQPSSPVGSGSSSAFTIQFDPSAAGPRTAEVRIESDDLVDPYSFAIQGTATVHDSDGDGITDNVEQGGDRDGDGVTDYQDYDPTGYFYDQETGEIISGGSISVSGPGAVTLVEDGSTGYYQFLTDGTAGTYTLTVTIPPGFKMSEACLPGDPPPYDPTGESEPVNLGNGENADTGFLTSNACTTFYLSLDLAAGDPMIINNNIPLERLPLPDTGFPPGQVTELTQQPPQKAYQALSGMRLDIPAIEVSTPLVGVPAAGGAWDVSWLGGRAGYLAGSAFPTWAGNTVITGHVWNADNQPGVFLDLKKLVQGDEIRLHAWGMVYTYMVQENRLISSDTPGLVFEHKEGDWVTLFTCEGYAQFLGDYGYRRMVQAQLIEVRPK